MNYLLWTNIFLVVFYSFYWVFLRKSTFFQVKRFYLLLAVLMAFSLPLLKVGQPSGIDNSMILTAANIGQQMNEIMEATQRSTSTWDVLKLLYIIGMGGSLGVLTVRSLITRHSLKNKPDKTAFSFFGRIVIDPEIEGYDRILVHERTHANELHSLDVLLFETVKIINWFNPIGYLMAKSVKLNHEYIADQRSVSSSEDRLAYAHLLLSKALTTDTRTLTNNFFSKTILKPRIAMLFQKRSKKTTLMSFTLLIPILALIVACQSSTKADPADDPNLLFTAVEVSPGFNGGIKKFYQYVEENYAYPEAAIKNKAEGRILVQFVVEKDGSLTDIKLLRDIKYGTGEEAIRVLKNSPKWNPGIQNGRTVRVQFTLPIQLNLPGEKSV